MDSDYEGSYSVFGVGTTSFNLSLNKIPERLSYTSSQTDKLSYITNSSLASGGVGKINLTSSGLGYKRFREYQVSHLLMVLMRKYLPYLTVSTKLMMLGF